MKASSTLSDREIHIDKDLFFQNSGDLLCIAGFDGFFKDVNPSVSNTLGYSRNELLSRPIDSFIHPEDRYITAQNRENLRNDIPLRDYENRYVTKQGNVVWLSWTSIPRPEEKLVYAIAKNVTHLKILERDRNALIENLTKVNYSLKQLTYTTSHDLRSPVSNLLSIFNLLDFSKISDDETLQFLHILKGSAENLKETLNNYVDILVNKDLLTVKVEELDILKSLDKIKQSLVSLMEASKTTIQVDLSETKHIRYNRAYLESTLLNLISNSIKYAIPGENPKITITSKKHGNVTQLIYSDRGQGFDMDAVRDKLFKLSQTFHNHAEGKGIGLYLVHSQITSLGGNIELESRPNEGARFTLTFKN